MYILQVFRLCMVVLIIPLLTASPAVLGCEYGDRATWCKGRHCYVEEYRNDQCCETCHTLRNESLPGKINLKKN